MQRLRAVCDRQQRKVLVVSALDLAPARGLGRSACKVALSYSAPASTCPVAAVVRASRD